VRNKIVLYIIIATLISCLVGYFFTNVYAEKKTITFKVKPCSNYANAALNLFNSYEKNGGGRDFLIASSAAADAYWVCKDLATEEK
jgi:hypothetical protein